LLSVLFCACATAQTRYAPLIEDIEHRLDKTIELYQQQKTTRRVGKCRPPISKCLKTSKASICASIFRRAKSYEMESTFGDIRRMIADSKPLQEVQARVDV
jgi:high-affinity iron transporter